MKLSPVPASGNVNEYWYNNKFRFDDVMWQSPFITENFGITQLGEVYCEKDISPPEHYQQFYELTFVVSGHGYGCTDGIRCELTPGTVYLSCPGEYHAIVSNREDSLRFKFVAFFARSQKAEKLLEDVLSHYRQKDRRSWRSAESFGVMRSLLDIYRKADTMYEVLTDLELQKLLVYTVCSAELPEQKPVKPRENNILFNLVSYIDINFLSITSIKALSNQFGYDYQYISKIFKSAFGVCIREYIVNKKLEHAKLLLTKERKTVTEVSDILGYCAPNNFSRAFKLAYGLSPRQFQKQETSI